MDRREDEDTLFAEANAWFFRLKAEDVTEAEKAAFAAWRAADPLHERAWREVVGLMSALKAPARAAQARMAAPSRRVRARRPRLVPVLSGLAATTLALFVAVEAPVFLDRLGADHVTVAGERRVLTLADGTRVDMNSDTALALHFSGGERRVEVRRGEAFFVIAEEERPFVVEAADAEIRDIGTAFSVENDAHAQVTVAEGLVDVRRAGSAPVRVAARQKVEFGGDAISPVLDADPETALAWRNGQIVFRQERLADVVGELNRYRAGRIVILNPAIADLLVSGVFEIDRPDRAVAALESVLGIRAHMLTPWLVLLR